MISRIEGQLVDVGKGRAELACGHLTYMLLVPAADEEDLAARVGQQVRLHTLHYLESQGQGTSFAPRLIGFTCPEGRAFFELLTTVKGLGARKALRALSLPHTTIARAIAARDAELLTALPEIGSRTAATIVAELHGKVDRFLTQVPGTAGEAGVSGVPPDALSIVSDAVAAMIQLGEPKLDARRLVERALADDPTLETADALVAAAYRGRAAEPQATE